LQSIQIERCFINRFACIGLIKVANIKKKRTIVPMLCLTFE
jgi:hypothetical protein